MREDNLRIAREQLGGREELLLGNVPSRGEFFLWPNQGFGHKKNFKGRHKKRKILVSTPASLLFAWRQNKSWNLDL